MTLASRRTSCNWRARCPLIDAKSRTTILVSSERDRTLFECNVPKPIAPNAALSSGRHDEMTPLSGSTDVTRM